MNTDIVHSTANYLTSVGITPYDLWMAIGQEGKVPANIQEDRIERVSGRDKIISPAGFVKNAIEDLQRLKFPNKPKVLADLKAAMGSSLRAGVRPRLGTWNLKDNKTKLLLVAALLVGFMYSKG